MPELPEVEAGRLTVEQHCLGQRIVAVNLLEQGGGPRDGLFDELVCSGNTEAEFREALLDGTIVSAKRRGKQLYFEVKIKGQSKSQQPLHLLFHFGMSGSFAVEGVAVPTYVNVKIDTKYPPKFCKFELQFANGKKLAFSDPRRLGRVKLLKGDPLTQAPLSKLARDPVLEGVGADFPAQLKKYTTPIKALLLDQEAVLCGIGNYLADEVLYQSAIHPKTSSSSIPQHKAVELGAVIEKVLSVACEYTHKNMDFPKDWLFHYRWEKAKGTSKMPNGNTISYDTVGGRTTAIVEAVQKKTFRSADAQEEGQGEAAAVAPSAKKRKVKAAAKVEAEAVVKAEAEAKADGEQSKPQKKKRKKAT